jgi:hypothetical protein
MIQIDEFEILFGVKSVYNSYIQTVSNQSGFLSGSIIGFSSETVALFCPTQMTNAYFLIAVA